MKDKNVKQIMLRNSSGMESNEGKQRGKRRVNVVNVFSIYVWIWDIETRQSHFKKGEGIQYFNYVLSCVTFTIINFLEHF
jgi:hypothetical protein